MRSERWLWLKVLVFIIVGVGVYPVSFRLFWGHWPASGNCAD
jgi:hypothetical protein